MMYLLERIKDCHDWPISMEYIEHEIKIVYREQVSIGRKTYLPYEVSCEGRYSGYGNTLEEAIKEFDKNNMD